MTSETSRTQQHLTVDFPRLSWNRHRRFLFSRISWWSARANFFRPSAALRHTHFLRGATLHPPLTVLRLCWRRGDTACTAEDAGAAGSDDAPGRSIWRDCCAATSHARAIFRASPSVMLAFSSSFRRRPRWGIVSMTWSRSWSSKSRKSQNYACCRSRATSWSVVSPDWGVIWRKRCLSKGVFFSTLKCASSMAMVRSYRSSTAGSGSVRVSKISCTAKPA